MTRSNGDYAMSTGALAARASCNVETIRYYERIGLLPVPARSAGGHRFYNSAHARRLTFIRRARALGFTLDEVRTLLRLADDENRPCTAVRQLAVAHRDDVRAKIADLKKMDRALEETIARCPNGAQPHCPIIEALSAERADLAV